MSEYMDDEGKEIKVGDKILYVINFTELIDEVKANSMGILYVHGRALERVYDQAEYIKVIN